MAAALSGSGLVVDLPIDIFEDALRSGIRAFKGKLGGIRCFLFDRTVKLVGSFLCQDFSSTRRFRQSRIGSWWVL